MSVILAAAIGGVAGNVTLLIACLAYLRHQRNVRRKARSEVFARYGMRIEIPPVDPAFREWLKKSIRIAGASPKPPEKPDDDGGVPA